MHVDLASSAASKIWTVIKCHIRAVDVGPHQSIYTPKQVVEASALNLKSIVHYLKLSKFRHITTIYLCVQGHQMSSERPGPVLRA